MKQDQLTRTIIGAAIEVHRCLGPGLLESAYEECLNFELTQRDLSFQRQLELPVYYKGHELHSNYRVDFVVNDRVLVELKAVQSILPIHEAQALTYMRLGNWKTGLLINFYVPVLKEGIKRLII
ncbi:GxxExxY protein [Candidatus Viridilinea mediisalina]|uniref:GxxExxY protein n=1 Tax=Candidatus Viridilinea mediisalina TaxID=2024553 RepID=A0A2A6RHC2_9CHLR|nr:GxxExxY protein [Candidatus Viridilinea mediisalina]PDW02467.1 GxxExxY protein [Candidatus Viridilinea mediisalina]